MRLAQVSNLLLHWSTNTGTVLGGQDIGELSELSSLRVVKGNWENGSPIGDIQIISSDWKYFGKIPDGLGQASGNVTYSDGSIYVGDIVNFIRCGIGKFTSKVGNQISGYWLDDTNVQFATSTDCEGVQWYGTLKNLKPEGFMKVKLPNGEKYDGVWLDGQMQRAFSIRSKRNAAPVYHFY